MEVTNEMQVARRSEFLQAAQDPTVLLKCRPEFVRHRKIVMNSRNGLHQTAVSLTQAPAVKSLQTSDIGATVLRQWNVFNVPCGAGHAADPQHLVVF